MCSKQKPVKLRIRVPPVVVKNFLYLNLLIILTLIFSALGLHYFLRPKALPTLALSSGNGKRSNAGVMGLWEIETGQAQRLLFEGIPILKRCYNP